MNQGSPAERVLLKPVGARLQRAVGLVALLGGVALLLGGLALTRAAFANQRLGQPAAVIVLVVVLLLAAILLVAGARMLFQLPNKYGAVFAPWVWFAIAGVMLLISVALASVGFNRGISEAGQGVVSALLLSLLSYGAGSHFRRMGRRSQDAP